jgi:hypothetical protein
MGNNPVRFMVVANRHEIKALPFDQTKLEEYTNGGLSNDVAGLVACSSV